MEHIIPTLLGIAGALAPVALGFWRQQRLARVHGSASALRVPEYRSVACEGPIILGGRVYL